MRRTAIITAVTFALRDPATADAGPYRVALVVEPTHTSCLSGPSCTSAGTAYATFPLVPSGMWRAEAGFTAQKQLAGNNGFSVFSTRYSATFTHDFSAAVRAYVRIQTANTTNLIAGMKILF